MPYLLYCIEIWGNSYKTYLKPIQVLQKKAIRIFSGAPRLEHTNSLFINLKLLKLDDMIESQTLLIMYKAYNILLPKNVQKYFDTVNVLTKRTRQKYNFKVKYVRTNLKAMGLTVRGVKLWNGLDNHLKNCFNVIQFKKSIKKNYLNQYENVHVN
jgi:FMN-dependent NADH-azoreductase